MKLCDVIIGAVNSFTEREQLERFARRYLIPYIDIGVDVNQRPLLSDYLISGQVIFSFPGKACLRCCNFITDERLAQEAQLYGVAGGRPQVVWPNGVLASTAIGSWCNCFHPASKNIQVPTCFQPNLQLDSVWTRDSEQQDVKIES